MPRPQFTLRALLVAMFVVGAFFGGAAWQRKRDESLIVKYRYKRGGVGSGGRHWVETVILQDGTEFSRDWWGRPSE